MINSVSIKEFLIQSEEYPMIDVRSPGEFRQGHIPGAYNIPLFSDEERAVIGTLYQRSGREASVLKGVELAGPKMAGFVKQLHQISRGKVILVHCWRGGLRSENMAWLFDQAGYQTQVLEGGYKAYRRYIRTAFGQRLIMIVLGGMTGSGKSGILQLLLAKGEQILDLEIIAHHKGSVFGALGQVAQPTNEQFENDLYSAFQKLDPLLPVWVEDESRTIGNVNIPNPLYEQMSSAGMVRIEIPRETRVNRLISEYSSYPKEELIAAIEKIRDRLGDRTNEAIKAVNNSDFYPAIDLILNYYDKTYRFANTRKNNVVWSDLSFNDYDPEKITILLLGLKKKIIKEYAKNS